MMTAETAEQVAAFIEEKATLREDPVFMEWFGGEPTLNIKAIDTISRELRQSGVWYTSSMVTNGLLMDDRITEERLSLWRLKRVQITLDGPESSHEAVKGFRHGAYAQILCNIHNLTKAQVRVRLRINYAGNDIEIVKLIEELGKEFLDEPLISAYINPIYARKKEYPREVMQQVLKFDHQLIETGLATQKDLFELSERETRCFMMTEEGFTIAPDGRLFNCSHNMTDEQCVGSIWNYPDDSPVRKEFLYSAPTEECQNCEMFAFCKGGCRIAEMGLAEMIQCHPYKTVFSEIVQ